MRVYSPDSQSTNPIGKHVACRLLDCNSCFFLSRPFFTKQKTRSISPRVFFGWVQGLEPWISRSTIWRANQLRHTHHITNSGTSAHRKSDIPDRRAFAPREPEGIRTPDPRLRRPLLYPTELQTHCPSRKTRAGDGNRTHVSSLEGWCSTIEPHLRFACSPARALFLYHTFSDMTSTFYCISPSRISHK